MAVWRGGKEKWVSSPQIFFLQFSKMLFDGVEYWLPVDIYCCLFVVSEHSGVYGNPKMSIFNSLDDGIKYHYFEV